MQAGRGPLSPPSPPPLWPLVKDPDAGDACKKGDGGGVNGVSLGFTALSVTWAKTRRS